VNPAFNQTDTFLSIAKATYNALTIMVNKRMSHGVQLQASYTLAKGEDNSPLTSTYIVGSGDDRLSDPSNPDRDKGVSPFNQTHTFILSAVIAPKIAGDGIGAAILNNNQLALIVQANSGLPFNIRSNQDLKRTGSPTIGPWESPATRGGWGRCSTWTPATRASSRSATAFAPSSSPRPRTSSTSAARIRPDTPPAPRTCPA
jgi:hypothetical protein